MGRHPGRAPVCTYPLYEPLQLGPSVSSRYLETNTQAPMRLLASLSIAERLSRNAHIQKHPEEYAVALEPKLRTLS